MPNLNVTIMHHDGLARMIEVALGAVMRFYDTDPERAVKSLAPIIVLGKPGIGKTVGLRELAQKILPEKFGFRIGYKEVRLASMSELDLRGLPGVETDEKGKKYTTYASNKALPDAERDGGYGILVLDEITSCSRAARRAPPRCSCWTVRAVLEIINCPIGRYALRLAMMPMTAVFSRGLRAAFINRCRIIRLEADFDNWIKWADRHDVHDTVKAFLRAYPDMFYIDPEEGSDFICASPRAWDNVSINLQDFEFVNGGRLLDGGDFSFNAVCASVSPSVDARFAAFYAYNAELISPEDVLAGKAKLADGGAGAKESTFLTVESAVSLLIKEFTAAKEAKGLTPDNADRLANFINFMGELRKAKGGEAAVSGLEQAFTRVPGVQNLLLPSTAAGKHFMAKHKNAHGVLVAAAKNLRGI